MYNLRPRNKSDNTYKYYLDDDEDSFTPKKNRKKTKNKTKAKTKNKRNNKKSINIKPEKTKITKNQRTKEFYPIISYISEIHDQIDYPKVKTKAYQENKSKEKFTNSQNKKYNKRKKEFNGNFRKENELKEEKFINIKKEEELKEYDYIKEINENKKRYYNTIHAYQNNKITKGKSKKEQNKKSTNRGNTKKFEKTKESIPKKKNNLKRNSKNDKSLNKSIDYDKLYNKYRFKNYSSYDLRKAENKSNINKNRINNNKFGSSYNNHKFKVILDESEEEEDIRYIDKKPKTINKKNNKILENEKNNKYEKDKNKHYQKGKNKVDKVIKNKTKIKKEENDRNLIRVYNNNIVDIDKSLLKDSLFFNQNPLPSIYSNKNNLINNKKTSEKCTLKTKYTEFHNKLFKYNDDDLEQYKFSTCQIDDELFTVTLNRFPRSNDIVIKIKNEENEEEDEEEDNNINLLGNKRKRNIKKEKIEDKKSKKKVKKRNNKENKEKEKKIKKEKQRDKEIQKTKNKKNKSNKNENKKAKKQKTSNIKVIQIKKEEYYEDDYDYDSEYYYDDDDFINNNNINIKSKSKRGTKKHSSMKKKEKENVKNFDSNAENEKENHIDDFMISSCSSLSDEDKNMNKSSINDSKNSMKYDNNKNTIIIKSEENVKDPENEKYQKMEGEDSPIFSLYKNNIDGEIENKEIKEKNISYNNCNDITINKINISGFSNKQYSYSSFENSFDYSFPIEYEDKIQIKEDITYFGRNTRYIKYSPIDEYATPISIKDKKTFKNRISKPKYINFSNKSKKDNNTIDSDLTDITSSNNNNDGNGNDNELPAILCIPRIKPFKDEHSKKIINKLKNCRIPQHKILDENVKKEEQKLYIGSFILYDENTNIKVNVPCYRENEITKEFMRKKNLGIIEFQEDNDIDTDEEQLQLEVERNNEALINFMKKVENDREYVEKNLTRKKRE